jgi:hypothetical protein
MKKHMLFCILLVGRCLASSATAAQVHELLTNGGFEEPRSAPFLATQPANVREFYAGAADSPFTGWAFGGHYEHGDYGIAISDEAKSGKHSCQIICNKKGRGGIAAAPLQLRPGTMLEVSCWVKAKDVGGGRVFLNFEGTPGDGWASKDIQTETFDWTHFTARAIVPGDKAAGLQTIVVFLYTTCEGSIWIDDVSARVIDANAPDEPAAARKTPKPIGEPADSLGYRVNVVSPLQKVFREDEFSPQTTRAVELAAARNEYVSAQVVIEAPWRPVNVKEIQVSDLKGPSGAVIPAAACKWERVEYVSTTVTPPYFAERGLGSYPDPLLPAGPFTVEQLSRTPVWITLKTPKDCAAGEYHGMITINPHQLKSATVPISLTVWDFDLTDQTHLRTLTWLAEGTIREWYGFPWSPEGDRKTAAAVKNYQDCLLEHRIGPGGEVAANVPKGTDGQFDFRGVDATLQPLIHKGMNAFIMGTAPNLQREKKEEYSPQFVAQFTAMLKAYSDHLREKGWEQMAYVYVYDEAPKSAWPQVQKIDMAIHAAAPDARILQCLNEPEGVRSLTGFANVFDVYVAQYHKAGVAASQKNGAEVWLALCCYPSEHPNFFIEYPVLDVRVTPWLCWKYKASGFEYWSPNAWGVNLRAVGEKWPKTPWVANAYQRYNGDGYLLYPGADGKPLSSIRLETLRAGLQDYEYLWTLNSLVEQAEQRKISGSAVEEAKRLLSLDGLVNESGSYSPHIEEYEASRHRIAESIVAMRMLLLSTR